MSSPESEAENLARLKAQSEEIHEGIVEITMAWSALESSMALLLRHILNDEDGGISSAIYFSPGSSDVRFKLVDAAFCELCGKAKVDEEGYKLLIAPWAELMSLIGGVKGVRNKVAHGQIGTVFRFGRNHVRLTAPGFNFAPFVEAHRKRQLPGMSGQDIKQSAAKMWRIIKLIDLFLPIAKAVHAKDEATLQKAFSAAAASLTKAPPRKADQNPQDPGNQPRSPNPAE
jgi:hypothetical protein